MGLLARLFKPTTIDQAAGEQAASGSEGKSATESTPAGLPDVPPPTYPRLRRGQPRVLHFAYQQSEDWFRKNASAEEAGPQPAPRPRHE